MFGSRPLTEEELKFCGNHNAEVTMDFPGMGQTTVLVVPFLTAMKLMGVYTVFRGDD